MNLKRIILAAAIGLQLTSGAAAQTFYSAPYIGDRVIYVDTVADMLALPAGKSLNGQVVVTKRYSSSHTAGDGSGNAYRSDTGEGGTPDGGFIINDTGTHWHAVDKSVANVLQFGALGDGSDDTPEIQAATDAVSAAGGGVVYLPRGTYRLSESADASASEVAGTIAKGCIWVKSNVTYRGDGPGQTILKPRDDCELDCPVFHLPDTNATRETTAPTNVVFRDLEIDGNKSRAGDPSTSPGDWGEGEGIDGKAGASGITIDNIYFHDCIQDGIDLDGCSYVNISNCRMVDCGGAGIHIQPSGATNGEAIAITNVLVEDCGQECHTAGLMLRCGIGIGSDDVSVSNFTIRDCVRGLIFGPSGSTGRRQASNGSIYNSDLQNIQFVDGCNDNTLTNVHTYTCGDNGVEISGSRANITGCSFRDATGYGVLIDGPNVNMSGTRLISGANETDALYCDFTGLSGDVNVIITGCTITKPTSGDSVEIVNAASITSGFQFVGNNLPTLGNFKLGDIGGPMLVGNSGLTSLAFNTSSNQFIRANQNYLTDNGGSGTIADTNATVVISHGLGRTPQSVTVTPTSDLGATERIWVTTLTSTQFTVNRSGTSGALSFYWTAKY